MTTEQTTKNPETYLRLPQITMVEYFATVANGVSRSPRCTSSEADFQILRLTFPNNKILLRKDDYKGINQSKITVAAESVAVIPVQFAQFTAF